MPYIQLNGTQYPLRVGAMRVGAAADAEIRLPSAPDPAVLAVVEVGSDQSASVRRAHAGAVVAVNGVTLGVEPTPLLHGDRIELAGHELLYGDDRKGGNTQYVPAMQWGQAAGGAAVAARGGSPTAATGGLLRSLVDGREYLVAASGVVIGRDAGCDVVVPSSEVSRRHAAIVPTGKGYELRDTSTNGVWLNGTRIEGSATLGRGDVVRIGGEEFRFYADAATAGPATGVTGAPAPSAPSAAAAPASPTPAASLEPAARPSLVTPVPDFELAVPAAAAPRAAADPGDTTARNPAVPAVPAASPAAFAGASPLAEAPAPITAVGPAAGPPRNALATLEALGEGMLKGRRFEIRHPLAHVGRGDHNDIVIVEESVSDSHAKLQKRDGRWFVVDMGSTNGTYVAGRRVEAEQEIAAGADVRFGGIKLRFQPLADRPEEAKGTRVIAGANVEAARRPAPPSAAPTKRPAPAPAATPTKSPSPLLLVLLVVLVAAAAAYFLGIGR